MICGVTIPSIFKGNIIPGYVPLPPYLTHSVYSLQNVLFNKNILLLVNEFERKSEQAHILCAPPILDNTCTTHNELNCIIKSN